MMTMLRAKGKPMVPINDSEWKKAIAPFTLTVTVGQCFVSATYFIRSRKVSAETEVSSQEVSFGRTYQDESETHVPVI